MDLKELFNYVNYEQISLAQVFLRYFVASFSGLIISGIYKLYHRDDKTNVEMMHTLIFIALIISSAMMIIGNNLASAFGLVGAVSIIRFRTVVKSARDMSFVLFAVVAGMSCGLGYLLLALSGVAFTGLVMLVIYFVSNRNNGIRSEQYRLKLSFKGSLSSRGAIEKVLGEHSDSVQFDSMKIDDERFSFLYRISLTEIQKIESITRAFNSDAQFEKSKISFTSLEQPN